jgi:hypothetical protein
MHAAHRAADDQTQMGDAETFGDQPIAAFDHVVIAVVRKLPFEPVRGLAGAAAADRVRHDHEVLRRIERLPWCEQLVGKTWTQPIGAGAGIALQQQHAVDYPARGVALCRSQGAVVEFQLG